MRSRSTNSLHVKKATPLIEYRMEEILQKIIRLASMTDIPLSKRTEIIQDLLSESNPKEKVSYNNFNQYISTAQDKVLSIVNRARYLTENTISMKVWEIFSCLSSEISGEVKRKKDSKKCLCVCRYEEIIHSIKKRYSILKHKKKQLEQENSILRSSKDNYPEMSKFKKENEKLREKVRDLSISLDEIEVLKTAEKETNSFRKNYSDKSIQTEYSQDILKLKNKLQEKRNKINALEENILSLQNKSQTPEKDKTISQLNDKLLDFEYNNSLLKGKVMEMQNRIEEYQSKLNIEEQAYLKLAKQISSKKTTAKKPLYDLKLSADKLNLSLQSLKNQFTKESESISWDFNVILKKLSTNPLTDNGELYKLQIRTLKDIEKSQKQTMDSVSAQLSISVSFQQKLQEEISDKEYTISQLKELVAKLQKEIKLKESFDSEDKMRLAIEKLQKELTDACRALSHLKDEADRKESGFSIHIEELNAIISEKDIELSLVSEKFQIYYKVCQELENIIPEEFKSSSLLNSVKSLISYTGNLKQGALTDHWKALFMRLVQLLGPQNPEIDELINKMHRMIGLKTSSLDFQVR